MAVVIALAGVVAPSLAGASTVQVQAVPGHPSATWNMQGATEGGNGDQQSKWTTGVQSLLRKGLQVIALQEAGQVPPSARWLRTIPAVANGVTYNIDEYSWGGSRDLSYIYFLQTDFGGNRVNYAIVTRQQAAGVMMLAPQPDNRGGTGPRPTLGIRLPDGTVFWTTHAGSYGPNSYNDAGHIVDAVNTEMLAQGVASWALLGDFNRTPDGLTALPAGVRTVTSGQPTQATSGRELDYMVTNDMTAGFMAARTGVISDHYSVRFGFNLQAAATASGQMSLTRDPERCAAVAAGAGNGTRVSRVSCADAVGQYWTFQGEGEITNQQSCLDAGNGGDPTRVTIQPCDGNPDQWWESSPDGTVRNDDSDLCLSGGSSANGYQLLMSPDCSASNDSEVWSLPVPTGPIRSTGDTTQCMGIWQDTLLGMTSCAPGGDATQTWAFEPDGTVRSAGRCLSGNSLADGSVLLASACSGAPGQEWVFGADGTLFSPGGQLCVATTPGGSMSLQACDGSVGQQWLRGITVGKVRTVDQRAACFLAQGAKSGNGTRAHLSGCDRPLDSVFSTDLDWTFASDGSIRQGTKCLDNDFVTSRAVWRDCDQSASQQWDLTQAGASLPGGLLVNRVDGTCLDADADALRLTGGCAASQQWILSGATALPDMPSIAGLENGPELVVNGMWKDRMLCASPSDDSVWLGTLSSDDRYCQWIQFTQGDHFALYNLQKGKVLAYEGGNGGLLVMEAYNPWGGHQQYFSLGATESWGAQALQSYYDSGQNVDAMATDGDYPRTDAVHTRGWRNGNQRELTWNIQSLPGTTLAVNGKFDDGLCASASNNSLWIDQGWSGQTDPYCWWSKIDMGDHFILYNREKGEVMAYEGGNEGPLVMETYDPKMRNQQYFSLGGDEGWGFSALQSYYDRGQNVDAKATNSDHPRTDAVHTRGWRNGYQTELTWTFAPSFCIAPFC